MQKEPDKWSSWLAAGRYANNKQFASQATSRLEQIRDKVIRNAAITEGNRVLDIGTGDGLIGLEALKFIGQKGIVYFTDISEGALDICQKRLEAVGAISNKYKFIVQSADDLNKFQGETIDVVTGRAVIMYIPNKQKCFDEFFRVLKPGGRVSLFEPINQFSALRNKDFLGLDFSKLNPNLAEKILRPFRYPLNFDNDAMLNFNEHDLFNIAEAAGFKEIKLDFQALRTCKVARRPWEDFLESSANPIDPPMKDILNSLGENDKKVATHFLLEAWEKPLRPGYNAEVYITATKTI